MICPFAKLAIKVCMYMCWYFWVCGYVCLYKDVRPVNICHHRWLDGGERGEQNQNSQNQPTKNQNSHKKKKKITKQQQKPMNQKKLHKQTKPSKACGDAQHPAGSGPPAAGSPCVVTSVSVALGPDFASLYKRNAHLQTLTTLYASKDL